MKVQSTDYNRDYLFISKKEMITALYSLGYLLLLRKCSAVRGYTGCQRVGQTGEKQSGCQKGVGVFQVGGYPSENIGYTDNAHRLRKTGLGNGYGKQHSYRGNEFHCRGRTCKKPLASSRGNLFRHFADWINFHLR